MNAKEIIELYDKGMMDENGELIKEVIEEYSKEDGMAYGHMASEHTPCGEEDKLVERALFLNELAENVDSTELVFVLYCMAKSYDEDIAEEIKSVGMNEEVLDIYVPAFVFAYLQAVDERYCICEACRQ